MLYRLKMGNLPIPRLYIAENKNDSLVARQANIPYFIKPHYMNDDDIVRLLLYPTLTKLFPHILWDRLLNINRYETHIVRVPGVECYGDIEEVGVGTTADIATETRTFYGKGKEGEQEIDISQFAGDLSSSVNIEQLQDLNLLPSFLDDIATNVSKNYYGNKIWSDGYNKKLKATVGNYDQAYEARNLIILDVSGSIPRGISATMLMLIETLRDRANADLIVTGSTSMWWESGESLPSPNWIRGHIGCGNEVDDFMAILREHVIGKHWGNVIAFGDYDKPTDINKYMRGQDFSGTTVEHLWSYHTCSDNDLCGYIMWVKEICGEVPTSHDTTWCDFMDKSYDRD